MKKGFNIRNINLYSLFKDLVSGIWIVIMVAIIGMMITHAYIKASFVPEYTSSAIYVVTPKQSTGYVYTNKRFVDSVITVFRSLLNSDIMQTRIRKDLHQNELAARMEVKLIEETNLMKVSVTTSDPISSFKAIGSIMNNYSELSEYLTSDAVFDQLEAPTVPTHSDNFLTPRRKSVQVGIISGLCVLLLLAAKSILRRTIKSEAAVEDQLETTLLGTIYHENKNRTVKAKIVQSVKALLISSPIISSKFIDAISNIRVRIEYEHERRPERNVVLISSVCENEGKSTIALNIALSMAKEGKKVIIIDADMRKPAMCKMLGIKKSKIVDMIKLLQGECGLDEVMYHDELGIDLVMSVKSHSSTYELAKSGAMKDLIRKCSKLADYVIIDTPPMSMVSDTEALLDIIDYAILVIRQDFSYEKDITNCINIMNDANCKFLGCILNDYKTFTLNNRNILKNSEDERAVEIYD